MPAWFPRGINLSADSHLSLETVAGAGACTADQFLGDGAQDSMMTDWGTAYSVAGRAGAGAGNRYEEIVYAIAGSSPCLAVRYFLHWTALNNYPPGTVIAFDEASLLERLNAMLSTLVIAR